MALFSDYPYTGKRYLFGYVRVKENAPWLDGYFNGATDYEQVTGITRGKIYEVTCVEGFGDVEDVTFIDDNGNEQTLGSFFFEEVNLNAKHQGA